MLRKTYRSLVGSIHDVGRNARALGRALVRTGRDSGPEAVVVMVGVALLTQHPLVVVASLVLVAAYDRVMESSLLS